MRRKYTPLVSSCLTRLQSLIDAAECDDCIGFPELNGSRILTPQEVAYVLDCSTSTIATLVREQKLIAQHLRGVTRFREEDVLKFLKQVPEEKKYAVA